MFSAVMPVADLDTVGVSAKIILIVAASASSNADRTSSYSRNPERLPPAHTPSADRQLVKSLRLPSNLFDEQRSTNDLIVILDRVENGTANIRAVQVCTARSASVNLASSNRALFSEAHIAG